MNDVFDPRFDILPKAQRALWSSLGEVTALDFVLFGGTAIALQLGHRTSVDFDFFSRAGLDPVTLPRRLPLIARATTLQAEPNTLTVSAPTEEGPVKLSFFGGVAFVDAARARATRDGILKVAPLNDLMATKLVVLQKRIEAKDYQDIAAMLRAGVSLADGLRRAGRMYGSAFQAAESLKAMVYFEGGDLETLPQGDRTTLIAASRSLRDFSPDR